MNAFTDCLALELEQFNIRVGLILPGRSPETRFGENARSRMGDFPAPYVPLVESVFAQWQSATDPVTQSSDVAEAIWRAATDPACPRHLPAGADAVALSAAQ